MRIGILQKVLIPAIVALLLLTIVLTAISVVQTRQTVIAAEDEKLQDAYNAFLEEIDQLSDEALALAVQIANLPYAQENLARQDREALITEYLSSYEQLDAGFDVPQAQFHLPPATSFVRLHSLDEWGDDLSGFRKTVVDVNTSADHSPTRGIEVGRGGLGIRGVAPVFYEGEHVGSFEIGLTFDNRVLEEFQAIYGGEWHVLLNLNAPSLQQLSDIYFEDSVLTTLPGPVEGVVSLIATDENVAAANFPPINPDTYAHILQTNETVIERYAIGQDSLVIISGPYFDYQGQTIGIVQITYSRTETLAELNRAVRTQIAIGVGLSLLLAVTLALIIQPTLRPIRVLSESADQIAKGNFDVAFEVKSRDEIGRLAHDFRIMVDQLRGLFGTLEERITERTRDLQTVSDVNSQISTVLDVNRLLQDVADLTKERFRLYHAHIYILDAETSRLELAAGAGHVGRQLVAEEHVIDLHNPASVVARAAREQASVPVQDVRVSETFLPNPLLPDTRSELAVPLIARGQVLGVLDVQSDRTDYFGQDVLDIMQLLAAQVANAYSNARLFEAVERTSRHEQAMGNITRHMQQAVDIDDVLRVTVRELGKALRVPYTAIELRISEDNGGTPAE